MSQVVTVSINSWNDRFVVNGAFGNLGIVSSKEFSNIQDALKELERLIAREVVRYEAGITGHYSR